MTYIVVGMYDTNEQSNYTTCLVIIFRASDSKQQSFTFITVCPIADSVIVSQAFITGLLISDSAIANMYIYYRLAGI